MVKQYVGFTYEVTGRIQVKAKDLDKAKQEIDKVKQAIKKAYPNARMTVVHELDESEGEDFLKATAPPGSVQREDLKERFGIDLDDLDDLKDRLGIDLGARAQAKIEKAKDGDIEKTIKDSARRMHMNAPINAPVVGTITMISGEPYKKREYCHAAACPVQRLLDMQNDVVFKEIYKEICKQRCLHTAWEFHDWLQKNGFEVFKKP